MIFPRLYVSDDFAPFTELIKGYGTQMPKIKRDTVLHDANGAKRTSYFIQSGIARLSFINEEGTEGTLFFFGKGSIYPINIMEDKLSTENYLQLVSVTELDVIAFPARRVLDMCAASAEFNLAIINHYVRYVNVLLTKQLLNSYNDSTQLVSALLFLYVYEQPEQNSLVDLTQEQIAQVTGLSRTQVTRVLKILRDDRVIETNRGRLQILDLEALRNRYTKMRGLI
ncbi:Crp/Fnr family transcriptional regulator [Arthrobacter sp. KNU40]|uniref:Crp/Fnr family transcriptional regulator n=1 Tax=Arthrobacter sp. KNU40 TaxID=3447965 RepID=UPI003F5FAA4F